MSAVTIVLSTYDAGCLTGVLNHEIERVERFIRVRREHDAGDDPNRFSDFLGQLRDCLAAVEKARTNTAPDLLSIARRWGALDGGAWNVERYNLERIVLLSDTQAAVAKAGGE